MPLVYTVILATICRKPLAAALLCPLFYWWPILGSLPMTPKYFYCWPCNNPGPSLRHCLASAVFSAVVGAQSGGNVYRVYRCSDVRTLLDLLAGCMKRWIRLILHLRVPSGILAIAGCCVVEGSGIANVIIASPFFHFGFCRKCVALRAGVSCRRRRAAVVPAAAVSCIAYLPGTVNCFSPCASVRLIQPVAAPTPSGAITNEADVYIAISPFTVLFLTVTGVPICWVMVCTFDA